MKEGQLHVETIERIYVGTTAYAEKRGNKYIFYATRVGDDHPSESGYFYRDCKWFHNSSRPCGPITAQAICLILKHLEDNVR